MKFNNKEIINIVLAGFLGVVIGINITLFSPAKLTDSISENNKPGGIEVCFTPPSGCAQVIAEKIRSAHNSIYLEAYGFTSRTIIDQLIEVSKRGVKVRALLDRSNFSEKKARLIEELRDSGIEIIKDKVPGIAHNKIIIIDDETVITGSFNFTESADKRNAENVVLIHDENVVSKYLANWNRRYIESVFPYE